jgi:RND family efflux transporter MFP subunit
LNVDTSTPTRPDPAKTSASIRPTTPSGYQESSSQPKSFGFLSPLPKRLLAVALVAALVYVTYRIWPRSKSPDGTETLTNIVSKMTLKVTVTERGNLESRKTVAGTCELDGYENKIIYIVEEGSSVKKGDVVVRFDSSKIEKEIAEQEIEVNRAKKERDAALQEVEVQKNKGESELAQAKMELKLADLDLKKYEEGDYLVNLNEMKGKIALAEFELEKNRDYFRHLQELVKSGFREPDQLQGAKQQVESARFNLQRDKEKLRVLQKYDHERSLTEYQGKAQEASRKVSRAKASGKAEELKASGNYESSKSQLGLQEKRLVDLKEELTKCELKAKQDGMVAYANREWYSDDRRIREGAIVHQRQVIFNLPDMSSMQVKVNVHESVVKKVASGQKAIIRVDAFPNLALAGTVKKVSPLADSSNSWSRGGVKEYSTIVSIDEMPDVALRPGMTAEVVIKVGEFKDVVAVPVQAVTEKGRKHFVFVGTDGSDEFERRAVKIGESNHKHVQIKSGLSEQEIVALDARVRAAAMADDDELDDEDEDESLESELVEAATDEKPGEVSAGTTPDRAAATVKVEAEPSDDADDTVNTSGSVLSSQVDAVPTISP